MKSEFTRGSLVEHAKNFNDDYKLFMSQVKEDKAFFVRLQMVYESIFEVIEEQDLDYKQSLELVFKNVFDYVVSCDDEFKIFTEGTRLYESVYNACFLVSLCLFIHSSKRIKGMSLRKFLYQHSPMDYKTKGSTNYFNYDNSTKRCSLSLVDEETAFRKRRHRILSERQVYNKKPEWSAISADSEHEWAFFAVLHNIDEKLFDVYKRLGNLYNDIYSQKSSAVEKFQSKLRKIKYEDLVELQKSVLEYISKNEKYYGINLYRFERQMKLMNITSEVDKLLNCSSIEEEKRILLNTVVLYDIEFTQLYQDFWSIPDSQFMAFCASVFLRFKKVITISSRLIFDAFVEKSCFGEKWEALFLDTINKLAEGVFYNTEELDYTIKPESQLAFEKILSEYVNVILS